MNFIRKIVQEGWKVGKSEKGKRRARVNAFLKAEADSAIESEHQDYYCCAHCLYSIDNEEYPDWKLYAVHKG
jgi:hypothetical protein